MLYQFNIMSVTKFTVSALILFASAKCDVDLTLTGKFAYTQTDGKHETCINNCVDNRCVDTSLTERQCFERREDVPEYFPYKKTGSCLSLCIPGTNPWCYTSNERDWERCNADASVTWARHVYFTDNYGACTDECRFYYTDSNKDYYWCHDHYGGGWDYCNPKFSYNFIRAKTYSGEDCNDQCLEHNGDEGYRWCRYGNTNQWDYCAYPPLPRLPKYTIHEILSQIQPLRRMKRDDTDDMQERYRLRRLQLDYSIIISIAESIEQNTPRYENMNVHEEGNPIYQVSLRRYTPAGTPPVVLRARVYPQHVRPSAGRPKPPNLDGKVKGDDSGHLVAYTLSGPDEYYNLFPQNYKVNRGDYAAQEINIRKFLREHSNGHVEMLVVLLYDDNELRPDYIAMLVKYYVDKDLYDIYYDFFYNELKYPNKFPTTPQPPNLNPVLRHIGLVMG